MILNMILLDQQSGIVYRLKDKTIIGRSANCDIILIDPKVSRHHAEVYRKGDRWFVQDLGSKNGTFHNDERISSPVPLTQGAHIKVGKTVFVFRSEESIFEGGTEFSDEPWLTKNTLTHAAVDPSEYDLTHESTRVKDPHDSAWLRARFTALQKISHSLRALTQTEQIEDAVARELLNIFPVAKRSVIVFQETPHKNLAIRCIHCRPGFDSASMGMSRTIVEHVIKSGMAVMSVNPRQEKPYSDAASVTRLNINSFMCAPLYCRGKIEKVIYLDAIDEKKKFTEDDLTLLTLIANQVSLQLENVGLLEDLNREKISLLEENQRLRTWETRTYDFTQIIGSSKSIQAAKERAKKAALVTSTVLLVGQRGTGKELFAGAIHYNSDRADKPFITVNCAAIADTLIESELFGYVKGAFSGADRDKKGLFEAAYGGTILLDEIGDMPLDAQAEILRVLENREVKRLGATETIKVDVRIIASTNKDLQEQIKLGKFRADLFDRLNVFPIELPPLCERKEDIPLLLNHFLRIYCTQMNVKINGFSAEALALLRNYAWPGNVRELKNAVERMVLEVGDKDVIEPSDLPQHIRGSVRDSEKFKSLGRLRDATDALQKEMIIEALDRFNGNRSLAAKHLGVSRTGLEKMMERLRLV